METAENDICIVVLIGLPASGKTTLSEFLMDVSSNVNVAGIIGQRNHNVVHICYDALVPLLSQYGETFKESRKKVVMVAQNIIQLAKAHKYTELQNYLKHLKVKSCREKSIKLESEILLLLIDDNMYYRSMRYEYYKLARAHTTSFVEICIHCPIGEACTRNSQRSEGRVPTDVITDMVSKLCCPNTNKTTWEKWFCCIYSCWLFDDDVAQTAFKVIENSLREPVPPLGDKDVKSAHEKTVPNLIHEADIALRKIVSSKIKQLNNTGKGEDHLKPIMVKKQILLKELKDGRIEVPDYVLKLFEESSNELQNELQLWWLDYFDENI